MDIQKNQTQESFEKLYVKNAPDWSLERDQDGGYKYHATQSAFLLFEQQQVEIDLLKAELAKAQAVPEWISVEDRMPEYGVLVLIHNHFTFETMHTAKLIQLDGENYWFFESDDDYLHTRYTSHWMPIYKPQEPAND